jgi:hypothetical protein
MVGFEGCDGDNAHSNAGVLDATTTTQQTDYAMPTAAAFHVSAAGQTASPKPGMTPLISTHLLQQHLNHWVLYWHVIRCCH